ncbi:DUF485 domain-containing protein [Micromonospora endophytica]|uniref:DUF485 domain-containing protein n=1 Tax=Micromonospora endophytica TaxID=515350 RepID=A0A2W2DAP0_9ACTN|nr:DUF485 domain-containing protein [Micromonospora endophytica]PZF96967.1 DUF485 domain-containing protein [Micromonospora endophytica]RIW45252.1 DUF485 domain-containing protein [Micromonospora endophytica]BCJ59522.1 membrane protein [Micromonospora endophytica]
MSTDTPASAPTDSPTERYLAVQRSAEFAGLRRALRGFVFPMTIAFFLWYALYVILSAYARDFMGTRLFGSNINVALVFGLLQFVSTFLIAWYYSRYADRKIDPVADKIRHELTGGES